MIQLNIKYLPRKMTSKLPPELILKDFGYLDLHKILKVKVTCKLWKNLAEYFVKEVLPLNISKAMKSSFLIARQNFDFEIIGPANLQLPKIPPEVYSIGFANLIYTMQNQLMLYFYKTCRVFECGKWKVHSKTNVPRTWCLFISMENGLYVFGGPDNASHDSVELLLNHSNKWQLLQTRIPANFLSSPADGRRFGLSLSRSEILLMGGIEIFPSGRALTKILKFNTVNLNWTYVGDLQEGRHGASAVLFKNKIIIAGGGKVLIDRDGLKSTEIIDLDKLQNADKALIKPRKGGNLNFSRTAKHGMGIVTVKGVQELIIFSYDKPSEIWNDKEEVWHVFREFVFPKGNGNVEDSVFVQCKM